MTMILTTLTTLNVLIRISFHENENVLFQNLSTIEILRGNQNRNTC